MHFFRYPSASHLLHPMASLPLFLLLFLLPLFPAAPLSAQNPAEREAPIRALVDRYASAREGEDSAAIRALFVEDADQLVSSGEWRRGREALVTGMLGSSRNNPGSRTIEVQTVRFLGDAVAIADARYEIAASSGRPARHMWSTFIAQKTPEGWKISAIRNMLPAQ